MAGYDYTQLLEIMRMLDSMPRTLDENCPRCHSAERVTKVSAVVAQQQSSGDWGGSINLSGGSSPTFKWWDFGEYRSSHAHGGVGGHIQQATPLARRLGLPPEPRFDPPLFGGKKARQEFDETHRIWRKTKTLWERCYYCELHDLVFVNVAGLGF